MGYILRPSNIHAAAGSKKPRRRSARTALLAEHASQYRPYGHVRGPPANRQQQYPAVNVRMDVFALDEIGSRVLRTVVNDSGLDNDIIPLHAIIAHVGLLRMWGSTPGIWRVARTETATPAK
jgi:hypothetical protein